MKRHFWKLEYSITLMATFAIILMLMPTSLFPSKEAYFVSKWNEIYSNVDYMFTAMSAQADSDIVKSLKKSKTEHERVEYMMRLVQPYLRLHKSERLSKHYKASYMDRTKSRPTDYYYFEKIYISDDGLIVGIKDISSNLSNQAGFMMMFDVNGKKGPNTWGQDIYGVDIYSDGRVKALGYDLPLEVVQKDCSNEGTGVFCSNYYRIGGEFNEE